LRSTLPSSVALDAQWLDEDGAGQSTRVVADPVQLEQILFNLCINARDAMDGAGRITVSLAQALHGNSQCASCRSAVQPGPWVELRVADTGPGVRPELLDRIFDPFFSTKAPGQGSGMGLAMVHGIVHDHQGHIIVENGLKGATFTVLLPLANASLSLAPAKPESSPHAMRLPSADLLLVEDDAFVGNYLQEHLSGWGLRIKLIRDPAEAARWLAAPENRVDLILTDLTMPGTTGIELAAEAARVRPGVPVVLLTGHGGELDEPALRAQGVTRVLRKPPDPMTLRSVLHAVIAEAAQAAIGNSNSAR
jgi:CheY-like chemotaxis protein